MPSVDEAPHMQSVLFRNVADAPQHEGVENLKRQILVLLSELDDGLRARCLDYLQEAYKLRFPQAAAEKSALVERIASGRTEARAQVLQSLDVLLALAGVLLDGNVPENDYLHWPADAQALGWIDPPMSATFSHLLHVMVKEQIPRVELGELRRRAESGVLPSFQSIGVTVEARAVNRRPFRWGMPLAGEGAYRPDIVGTAIVASVQLGVNRGVPADIYFQIDEVGIDNIISSLVAAKAEMYELKNYLRLDEEGRAQERD